MSMSRRTKHVLMSLTLTLAVIAGLQPTAYAGPPGGRPDDSAAIAAATDVARARVASEVLLDSYDPEKAWFPSSWWNSAVALQTLGDYMLRTGDRSYVDELDHSFETNKGPFPAGERSTDEIYGNFTSRAIDDAGWWALNWVTAYDLTGEQKYLDMAETIGEFMLGFWDPSTCGGGTWWNEERTYKNAVTNGQWVRLTAELHNRIPGDTAWLDRSLEAWDWYQASGMINDDGLVNDGLTDDCASNGDTVWTYNQGLAIGAPLELYRATGDADLLAESRRLADAALDSPLVVDGVLTESCDALDRSCDDNQKQFKGIFMRYLMDLADTTGDDRYRTFAAAQAETVWANDRDSSERLGQRWAGGTSAEHPNVFDWRTQASALSALIADVPQDAPGRSLSATMSPDQLAVLPSPGARSAVRTAVEVAATSDHRRPTRVDVRVEAPRGWAVRPARSHVVLRTTGDGTPARATVPLDVTIPAGTPDGSYPLTATVTSRPGLTWRTRATVQVASVVDFDAGSTQEVAWLWDAGGSGLSQAGSRFADGTSRFVYRFPFPAETTAAEATLTVDNQYVVALSGDGEDWTVVLEEDEEIRDGSNRADHTLDLTPYLGDDKAVYVRVTDAFPADGWGGGVYHVTATYTTP